MDSSWIRKTSIPVISRTRDGRVDATLALERRCHNRGRILRFIPYCQNKTVIEKILESWYQKVENLEQFSIHLSRFGSFETERILDFDYYQEFTHNGNTTIRGIWHCGQWESYSSFQSFTNTETDSVN